MVRVVSLRRLAGAQYNLAMSLLKGVGVTANADEATYWFQKAAAQVSLLQYCVSNLVPLTRL
jgi:TPR repeat protein